MWLDKGGVGVGQQWDRREVRERIYMRKDFPGEYNQSAPCQSVGSFQVLILSLMVCLYHYPMPW